MPHIEYKKLKLTDLKPSPYNPRKISEKALKGLANSIDQFGLVQPIIVNQRTGMWADINATKFCNNEESLRLM